MKINFVFPGQGAQQEHMGMDFYEASPEFKSTVEEASDLLHEDIAALFQNGERLKDTLYAQKAIFVLGVGLHRALAAKGIQGDQFLGLSLGEYTALTASGVLDLSTALLLLDARSMLMQKETQQQPGFMVAVKNIPPSVLVEAISKEEGLYVSNFNSPGQTVLGGSVEKKERLLLLLEDIAPGGAVVLPVAGAFHTPLMVGAEEGYRAFLEETLKETRYREGVLSNVKGDFYASSDDLKDILARHITSPVRLSDCFLRMDTKEDDLTVLFGPGKTLMPIARGNKLQGKILTVESVKSFDKLMDFMGGI